MSSLSLDDIVSRLRELAGAGQPGLSRAADTAVKLRNAAPNVRSERKEYNQLATNACELVYGVAEGLRAKGQRNVDNELKHGLDHLSGILEKVLDLARENAARSESAVFWYSDVENLKALRKQLEQCLPVFGIRSFTDLQCKANLRPQPTSDNKTTTVNNNGTFYNSNLSHINQGDYGTVNQGDTYKAEMFKNARNFKIHGAEFNNVGRDMNKMTFSGKNVAPNFGLVGSQDFS